MPGGADNLLTDFASQLKATADPEIIAARSDICAFTEYVLRDGRGQHITLKPFHRQMLEATQKHRFLVIRAFRGASKSSFMSVIYPLWLIMKNRDVRIMLLTASDTLSKQWLRQIEGLMNSPQYIKLAGEMIPSGTEKSIWTNDIKVVKGRSDAATGATLLALGVHGQIRGRRVDVAIADDLCNETNSLTQYTREVLNHWFHSAVLPTLDHYEDLPLSGQCIVVGTPLYDSDLLATLSEEWK